MSKYFFGILIALLQFLTVSTNAQNVTKYTDPVAFNDRMVSVTANLTKMGSEWAEKLTELAKTTLKFEELQPLRVRLSEYVDREIHDLTLIKDHKGSNRLRMATIDFLKNEKSMINNGFAPFEKLNAQSTEEDFNKVSAKLDEEAKKEEQFLNALRDAQEEYAKKNDFGLEGMEGSKSE